MAVSALSGAEFTHFQGLSHEMPSLMEVIGLVENFNVWNENKVQKSRRIGFKIDLKIEKPHIVTPTLPALVR